MRRDYNAAIANLKFAEADLSTVKVRVLVLVGEKLRKISELVGVV